MGYMIEITESKKEKLTECTEKILRSAGKMMQYLEDLGDSNMDQRDDEDFYDDDFEEMNHRDNMGMRGGYGMRDGYGMRGGIYQGGGYGNRRGVKGTGRYSRYR